MDISTIALQLISPNVLPVTYPFFIVILAIISQHAKSVLISPSLMIKELAHSAVSILLTAFNVRTTPIV